MLSDHLGPRPVLGGFCRIFSAQIAPGRVRHSGSVPYLAFGELSSGPCPRGEPLLAALKRAGIDAELSTNVVAAMWEKFLFIAAAGALGARTGLDIGSVRSSPVLRASLTSVLSEIASVAAHRDIDLGRDPVGRTLAYIDSLPAEGTTSMQRDIASGRPSELNNQLGAVVRLGRESGIPTPVSAEIYAELVPKEQRARASSRA